MEKLLNLLNEYKQGKPFQFTGYDEEYGMFDTNLNMDGNTSLPAETIVCKKFGFIQWLVVNDKIKKPLPQVLKDIDVVGNDTITGVDVYSTTDSLLMLLAIKDDSIAFLVSILK